MHNNRRLYLFIELEAHYKFLKSFVSLIQIAGKINRLIREVGLRELGHLEQDLVFGDAGMKDVIKYLTTKDVRGHKKHIWVFQTCQDVL